MATYIHQKHCNYVYSVHFILWREIDIVVICILILLINKLIN